MILAKKINFMILKKIGLWPHFWKICPLYDIYRKIDFKRVNPPGILNIPDKTI